MEIQNLILKLEQAASDHQTDTIKNLVYNLKSSCKEIGAVDLFEISEQMETAMANAGAGDISKHLSQLNLASQTLVTYFATQAA